MGNGSTTPLAIPHTHQIWETQHDATSPTTHTPNMGRSHSSWHQPYCICKQNSPCINTRWNCSHTPHTDDRLQEVLSTLYGCIPIYGGHCSGQATSPLRSHCWSQSH